MKQPDLETIETSISDSILTVTMNRPDRLNAFNNTLHHELVKTIQYAAQAEDINVIVLTGAGRAFSAGGDMSDLKSTPDEFMRESQVARELLFGILDCDKPIICRMNGDAIGLGATIALLCDVVIAADIARIGDPHVKMGLVAGDGGALIWPLLVGPMLAKYYLLTGDLLSAEEAAKIGLITRSVPVEDLDNTVDKIASKLSRGAPLAIRWTKRAINAHLQALGKTQFDLSLGYEGITFLSQDHAEAKTAFFEKRRPKFQGK